MSSDIKDIKETWKLSESTAGYKQQMTKVDNGLGAYDMKKIIPKELDRWLVTNVFDYAVL